MRLLREHGMKVRYHHDIVGYNFRMTDLAAAIGLAQLPKLPASTSGAARSPRATTPSCAGSSRRPCGPASPTSTTSTRSASPTATRSPSACKERGVGSAIYYPIPVHRQKPFVALGYGEQRYPVTERLTEQVLSIPVHPSLTDDEVATVIGAVNETAAELGTLEAAAAG